MRSHAMELRKAKDWAAAGSQPFVPEFSILCLLQIECSCKDAPDKPPSVATSHASADLTAMRHAAACGGPRL